MRRLLAAVLLAGCASQAPDPATLAQLDEHAYPITGAPSDYDPLFAAIGGASLVLLGEATHGTHEFYNERARITMRLVEEKRFKALALEADWSDAARVNDYVRGTGSDQTAEEALRGFERFPRWMWRNREFAALVQQLREYNDALPPAGIKVGVYGLDLYGDEESREFLASDPPRRSPEERFAIEQNELVVRSAAEYHREAARGHVSSWNIRDRHMVASIAALQKHLLETQGRDHIVVWAHNSHVGDARATERTRFGEWNMGQLVREHWPRDASFIVGFSTATGTVMAADRWGGRAEVKKLRVPIRGSHGAILSAVTHPSFLLILEQIDLDLLDRPRPQRAVGVIYRPTTEYESHYYTATLTGQFDAVIHFDETRSLEPLD